LVGTICTEHTVCDAASTTTTPGDATTDTTCTCKSDYHTLHLGTSCTAHTVCDATSTDITTTGSATVDVSCDSKRPYHSKADVSGVETCTLRTVCGPGTDTNPGGATSDDTCACKGGYHTLAGTTCTICAKGHKCNNGAEVACGHGKYQAAQGSTGCTDMDTCGPGKAPSINGVNTIRYDTLDVGQISSPTCTTCATETYSNSTSLNECASHTKCPIGQGNTFDGAKADNCDACTGAEYSATNSFGACGGHTVCDAASTDTSPGTASADATCACKTGFHNLVDGTSCTAHTVCDPTSTDASTGSATADVVCTCATGFHTLFGNTILWQCTAHTVCDSASTTVTTVGSAIADGFHSKSDVSGVETCTLRTVCDADSTDTSPGTAISDDTCTCKGGFHTLDLGTTCTAHTVCDPTSTNASTGSATVDVVCTCKGGFHTLDLGTTCTAHTVCDTTSTDVTTVGSATVDVACACKSTYHSIAEVSGEETCTAHTVCDAASTVTSPGDATTDTTCTCATGYHTLVGGTTCTENQCACTNGTAATNTACPTDGDAKCMSCGTGFNLSDEVPEDGTTCIVQCSVTCEIAQPRNRIVVTHDTTSGHSRHLCYKQGCGPTDTVGCTCAYTCSGDGVVFTPSHWGDHDNNAATRDNDSTGAVAENWGAHSTSTIAVPTASPTAAPVCSASDMSGCTCTSTGSLAYSTKVGNDPHIAESGLTIQQGPTTGYFCGIPGSCLSILCPDGGNVNCKGSQSATTSHSYSNFDSAKAACDIEPRCYGIYNRLYGPQNNMYNSFDLWQTRTCDESMLSNGYCNLPSTNGTPANIGTMFGMHQTVGALGCGNNLDGYTYFKDTGGYDLMSFHSA
jgi:hypothetical protein